MLPINWYLGLAIKDDNDPFVVALREGRIQPGEVETIVLGGGIYVVTPPEPELPEGLWEKDGKIMFECRTCGAWTEWPAEIEDYEHGVAENVCGGSQWCLP